MSFSIIKSLSIKQIGICLLIFTIMGIGCKVDSAKTAEIKQNLTEQVNKEVEKISDLTTDTEIAKSFFDPPHDGELTLISRDDGQYDTPYDIKYTDPSGKVWTAPKGTITDGASIPEKLSSIFGGKLNPTHLNAAIVHDAYCGIANKGQANYCKETWQNTHRMFYQACLKNGKDKLSAGTMYAGVRLGGPRWDENGSPLPGLEKVGAEAMTKAVLDCKAWLVSKGGFVSLDELETYLDKVEAELLQAS